MAPHNTSGPVGHAALIHADAAMSNLLIQEITAGYLSQFDRFAEHPFQVREGYMNVPEEPGLGVTSRKPTSHSSPIDRPGSGSIATPTVAGRAGSVQLRPSRPITSLCSEPRSSSSSAKWQATMRPSPVGRNSGTSPSQRCCR